MRWNTSDRAARLPDDWERRRRTVRDRAHNRCQAERQKLFGVSHMDVLRLCAAVEGRMDDAADFDLTPIWADTDVRTINQAVDALGKAAQMLGVPRQMLWDMIPGVSKSRADGWREYADEHPDADTLAVQAYQAQLAPVTETTDGIDQ